MSRNRAILVLLVVAIVIVVFVVDWSALQGRFGKDVVKLPAYNEKNCYDSDGGVNFEEVGTIYGLLSRSEFGNKTDDCKRNQLTEYYCSENWIQSEEKACEYGCEDGACKVDPYEGESGDLCKNYQDDDGDGLIDCYDSSCSDYDGIGISKCSEYQGAKLYKGVGTYTLKRHDRIQFENGLIAEFGHMVANTCISCPQTAGLEPEYNDIEAKFYYEKDGKIVMHPLLLSSFSQIPSYYPNAYPGPYPDSGYPKYVEWSLPYMSLYGAYVHLKDYNPKTEEIEVEVFGNCTDMYDLCMAEENLPDEYKGKCATNVCPYEEVNSDFDAYWNEKFKVVFPVEDEKYGQIVQFYLPACFDYINEIFGAEQPFEKYTVRFNNADEGKVYPAGAAVGDRMLVNYNGSLDDVLASIGYKDDNWFDSNTTCGIKFFPFVHELVHAAHFGTILPGSLQEGFANYLTKKVKGKGKGDEYLKCEEDYYYYANYFTDNGISDPVIELYSETDSYYILGDCFWQLIEGKYGWDAVGEMIKKMGQLRNLPKYEPYDFLNDIVAPVIGELDYVKATALKLGLSVDCQYKIGSSFGTSYGMGGGCKD